MAGSCVSGESTAKTGGRQDGVRTMIGRGGSGGRILNRKGAGPPRPDPRVRPFCWPDCRRGRLGPDAQLSAAGGAGAEATAPTIRPQVESDQTSSGRRAPRKGGAPVGGGRVEGKIDAT